MSIHDSSPSVMNKLMAAFSPIRMKKNTKPKLKSWDQKPESTRNYREGIKRTASERGPTPRPHTPTSGSPSSRSLRRASSERMHVRTHSTSASPPTMIARSSSPVPCSPVLRPAGHSHHSRIPPLQESLQIIRIHDKSSGYMKSRDHEPQSPAYDKKIQCQNCSRMFWASEGKAEVELTRSGQLGELSGMIADNAARTASLPMGTLITQPEVNPNPAAADSESQKAEFCSKECMWSYSMRMSDNN